MTLTIKKPTSVHDPYKNFLIPAVNAFVDIELRGFHYNIEAAADLNEREVLPRLRQLTDDIRKTTGRELINPRSWKQMQAVMYEQYGLKHDLKGQGGKLERSTSAPVRTEILEGRFNCLASTRSEFLSYVRLYDLFQKVDKQRGNYIEGLIKRVQSDGKLYSNFKFGTVTGRTSSDNPNFQNITRSGRDVVPGIRTLFTPSPGNVIVQADYSQAELRTCAVLSNDEGLRAIYSDPTRSLHRERAAAFYGEDYSKEEYTFSKNINFGVTYGQSAFAFAQMYARPVDEAQGIIDGWWADYPRLLQWTEEVKETMKSGEVVAPTGLKRRFHLITKENKGDAEREAVNFLPQHVASYFTVNACIELVKLGCPIVSTVHDSIIIDCPRETAMEWARTMKQIMEDQPPKLFGWEEIPFVSDISIGENWGTVEEVELIAA